MTPDANALDVALAEKNPVCRNCFHPKSKHRELQNDCIALRWSPRGNNMGLCKCIGFEMKPAIPKGEA